MNGAGISDIALDASRFKDIGHSFPEKRILTKNISLKHVDKS